MQEIKEMQIEDGFLGLVLAMLLGNVINIALISLNHAFKFFKAKYLQKKARDNQFKKHENL